MCLVTAILLVRARAAGALGTPWTGIGRAASAVTLILHLVLAYPSGRLKGRLDTGFVAVTYCYAFARRLPSGQVSRIAEARPHRRGGFSVTADAVSGCPSRQ